MFKPTDPETARRIELLATLLMALPIGYVITYAAMSDAAGIDVQNGYVLRMARRQAERDLGCLYAPERGIGIRRLEGEVAPEVGLAVIGRVRRAARRGKERLANLRLNSLPDAEQRRVIGYRSMLGAIAMMADGRKARRIAAAEGIVNPVPPADVLRMFALPAGKKGSD